MKQVLLLPGEDINKELYEMNDPNPGNVQRYVIPCPWGPVHYPLLFEIDTSTRNIYQDKKSPWSCGPVTVVLFIQQLLSLVQNEKIRFNGVRHVQRLKIEKWDTFGNSCYMTEDPRKGVWWNWKERSKKKYIEEVIMDYLFG